MAARPIACAAGTYPLARPNVQERAGDVVIIVNVGLYDRFLILPRGRRNTRRRAPKRVNGKVA